jgi:hypothetical protein
MIKQKNWGPILKIFSFRVVLGLSGIIVAPPHDGPIKKILKALKAFL